VAVAVAVAEVGIAVEDTVEDIVAVDTAVLVSAL